MSTADAKHGVDLGCVDTAVLNKYCKRYKVPVAGTLDERVSLLAAHIRKVVPKPQIADCDNCGGDSNIEDEVCPYCGIGGFDAVGPRPEPVTPEPPPPPVVAPAPANPTITPTPPRKRSDAKGGNGAIGPVVPAPEVLTPPPPPDPPVMTAAKPAPKKKVGKSKTEAAADRAVVVESIDPPTELVPNLAQPVSIDGRVVYDLVEVQAKRLTQPATDIDEAVASVHEAKRLAVVCYWHLGHAVLRCFEGDLWKQRRDETGQPVYKGFTQFSEAELGMAASYAYKLMNVAATFSAADVAKIGVAKLGLMLRLDPATRDKLLLEVRGGIPYSEVADTVKRLADGTPPQRGQGKKDTSKASTAAAMKAKEASGEIVTATFETKRVKVPLYVRANKTASTELKRAKRLADDPWGEFTTINGVTIRLVITTDAEGRLQAIVEAKREPPPKK